VFEPGTPEARREARLNVAVKRSDPLPPEAYADVRERPEQREAVAALREFCASPEGGIYLYGPPDAGKTLLAARTAFLLRKQGIPALFIKAKRSLDAMRDWDTPAANGYGTMVDYWTTMLRESPALIFDDLGAHRNTPYAIEQLTHIFDFRHDFNRATIVTSNLTNAELRSLDVRLHRRIWGMCQPIMLQPSSKG
jgi:DNA replication protein DnaC